MTETKIKKLETERDFWKNYCIAMEKGYFALYSWIEAHGADPEQILYEMEKENDNCYGSS